MKRVFAVSVILWFMLLSVSMALAEAKPKKKKPVSYESPVPRFTFAETLAEQEKQLTQNPLLERFRVSRAKILKDPHHPIYHFTSPENRLNDPDGLCFWQGQWHMFYQGYRIKWTELPTVVSIDSSRSTLAGDVMCRPPETAQVEMGPDEPLKLHVFIDRSIVEVFINGRQCVTARVYPDRSDSIGVSLRAQGKDAKLRSLDAWQMKSIYD